jgi:hypothetical protein
MARRPMEQPGTEMLLQLGDLAGYGRLADLAFTRDRREGSGLDHPDEAAKRTNQVHLFHRSPQKSYPERSD